MLARQAEVQQRLAGNTLAVLTEMPENRDEWRATLAEMLDQTCAQGADWQIEVDLLTALLALQDGTRPVLPAGHPHRPLLDAVLAGLDAEVASPAPALPTDFVARCVGALQGTPDEKIAFFGHLEALAEAQPGHAPLLEALRTALFLPDPAVLDPDLAGEDEALWAEVVRRLAGGG